MVEMSESGSGKGLGWVTGGYSTQAELYPLSFLLDRTSPNSPIWIGSVPTRPVAPPHTHAYHTVHKHIRDEMRYCFNAHFQPEQDTHVDLDTYRYLQALKSIGATLLLQLCRSTIKLIRRAKVLA